MSGRPRTVADMMTSQVVSVGREASFTEIVRLFQDHKVSVVNPLVS